MRKILNDVLKQFSFAFLGGAVFATVVFGGLFLLPSASTDPFGYEIIAFLPGLGIVELLPEAFVPGALKDWLDGEPLSYIWLSFFLLPWIIVGGILGSLLFGTIKYMTR